MSDTSRPIPHFAAGFPVADEAQWRELVDKVLKGGKFDRLVGKTSDDIEIQPLYPRREGGPRAFASRSGGWTVLARVDHPDAAQANALALADIVDGASGLQLIFEGAAGAHGFGLPWNGDDLRRVLAGIDPAGIEIELDLGVAAGQAPEVLADFITKSGLNPASAAVSFGLAPLGQMSLSGETAAAWEKTAPELAAQISALAARGFAGPFCVADGRIVHAAGGSEAQELAFTLATAVAYLRTLEQGGLKLPSASSAIGFRMAADADQFLTVAKFRALRLLWARVEEACGLAPRSIHIHAETAWRMMSRRDPAVNLLRATVAVFSAATGGADGISVLPYTQALGLPDAQARRLARNTQLVLLEEANIAKVGDPAAGAGGIESLTGALCEKAWAIFQSLEATGGIGQPAARAFLRASVSDVNTRRQRDIATRREPLTGVSEFPNIREATADVLLPLIGVAADRVAHALTPVRNSEAFETLRDRAEACSQRPKIFLASMGPVAAFTARANFAANLFEAGGLEAISNDGFDDIATLVEAFRQSGAELACICSSDEIYAKSAPDCARGLKAAGAKMIYLAGRPGEQETAQREAGIDRYAYAGCDAIALLQEALALCS